MEQPQLTMKLLTLPELRTMALQSAEHLQISIVIEQAMTRRLSEENSGTTSWIPA